MQPTSLQQLQKQLLDLPISDRWQLVQLILESLQQDTIASVSTKSNLSRLRAIAKAEVENTSESLSNDRDDYTNYLSQKYQ